LLNAYVYGTIGRTMPPAYPTSPGFFQMPSGIPGPFSFHMSTLAGPAGHAPDNRAFYDAYAPTLNLPHNLSALNGNPNVNGHRGVHNDSAQAYAIPNQFSREQLLQRNLDIYSASSESYLQQPTSPSSLHQFATPILTSYQNGYHQ
jgi:hypothetical protein